MYSSADTLMGRLPLERVEYYLSLSSLLTTTLVMPYRCPEHCTFQSDFIQMTFDPCSLKCKVQFKGNRRKNITKYILSAQYFSRLFAKHFHTALYLAYPNQGIRIFTSYFIEEKIGFREAKHFAQSHPVSVSIVGIAFYQFKCTHIQICKQFWFIS